MVPDLQLVRCTAFRTVESKRDGAVRVFEIRNTDGRTDTGTDTGRIWFADYISGHGNKLV